MSLSPTSVIKAQLSMALGPKAPVYYHILRDYLAGSTSRTEFDDQVKDCLGRDNIALLTLHNSLIVSLFDTSAHLAPPTPPPEAPKPPPRKRRRTLPYQGPHDDAATLRSARLTQWTVGMGRRERERLRLLEGAAHAAERRPRPDRDEIAMERGVVLLPERGEPPGSRLPLHLASAARAPTLQHIIDRINLISAQHNLNNQQGRQVASLLMLAFEAKLKQLITQALSLTSASHAITSIRTSARHTASHLTAASFDSLFTLSPAVLPNKSAAAMRLAAGDAGDGDAEDEFLAKAREREVMDARWQMFALLGERSTVREALRTLP